MTDALVSIVIPCFNAEEYIARAIRGALEQTHSNTEIIVVDDGSTDGSLGVIQSFGQALRFEAVPHGGAAAARNRGLEMATGDLVQFLDADDVLYPEKIRLTLEQLGKTGADVVFCNGDKHSEEGACAPRFPESLDVSDPVLFMLYNHLPIQAPLHWRKNIQAVHGFREDLCCCQDLQLHLDLACAGLKFHYFPARLYGIHRMRGSLSAEDARRLDLQADVLWPAYGTLQRAGRLTDIRARALAEKMAETARHAARLGNRLEARAYFRQARRMHREGGLGVYSRPARFFYHLLGPARTERAVKHKRRENASTHNGPDRRTPVIYLVHRDGLSPITPSVAAVPMGKLRRSGRRVSLLFFAPIGEGIRPSLKQRWREAEAQIYRDFTGPLNKLWSPPSRFRGAWDEGAALSGWMRRNLGPRQPLILHCQSPMATRIGLEARRVLQVHQGLGRDGVIAGSSRIAAGLTQRLGPCTSYDAALCLLGSEDPFWSTYGLTRQPYALNQSANYRNPAGQFRSILSLRKLIRIYAPHIVHSHTWPVAMIAGFAVAGLPVRHVIHIHDMRPWLASPRLRQRIRRSLYRWSFRLSRATFVACAEPVRDYAARHLLSKGSHVHVLYSGIDLARFEEASAPYGEHPSAEGVVLGMSGAFQPMKGHEYLLKALAVLRGKGLPLRLVCAGWGAMESEYKRMVDELGLTPFVEFLGRVREMKDFYRRIDICVLPSLSEGLPLSLLEAMAMRKPVIATRVGGIPFAVRDGIEGLIVPPADAGALAAAIERLAKAPELRAQLGARGKMRVERDFSMDEMVRKMSGYYESL